MNNSTSSNFNFLSGIQWVLSRVAVIYVILFIFCNIFVDLKDLDSRIKIRHLNDAIPNFNNMIGLTKNQISPKDVDWGPYQYYFKLVLKYIPDDMLVRQLLGYVDFNVGQEQNAIDLFSNSSVMNGQNLLWSNYNLGVIYYKKGMWPQASQYLFKAITSSPNVSMYLMQHSMVYKQILASPAFDLNLNDDIRDAQSRSYILLLSCMYKMKQYDKLVLISNLAFENKELIYKDAYFYYTGLGLFEMGQFDKAFLLFQQSLTIEKDNPDVYYYIALIYQRAGQLQQARDYLQISYALHQKNDPRFPYDMHTNLRVF